jgi:hypothetical protein
MAIIESVIRCDVRSYTNWCCVEATMFYNYRANGLVAVCIHHADQYHISIEYDGVKFMEPIHSEISREEYVMRRIMEI